ncbi:antitoxin protein of toxin-antitoxin system [Amycolatopsis sulphurea]|uniref:Antitoxin protein of toxin-antitoxin system n=1 Tax=Amycolatopsis sulphurea TaxID=76022 RepID=A0A2A9G0Z0_9PSEU|nr:antitoxin [Amycolatopsis sulphurea]PFG56833.1 antitoxin protein of toxin-antitoxin system [Amycolatopsis sulphurea]
MSFFDQAKEKLQEFTGGNKDKTGEGIDKAADFADEKTGGGHGDQIRQGADKLKEHFGGGDQPEGGGQPEAGQQPGGPQPGGQEQQFGDGQQQ